MRSAPPGFPHSHLLGHPSPGGKGGGVPGGVAKLISGRTGIVFQLCGGHLGGSTGATRSESNAPREVSTLLYVTQWCLRAVNRPSGPDFGRTAAGKAPKSALSKSGPEGRFAARKPWSSDGAPEYPGPRSHPGAPGSGQSNQLAVDWNHMYLWPQTL